MAERVHEPWCCLSVEDHGCPCLCTSPSAREEYETRLAAIDEASTDV